MYFVCMYVCMYSQPMYVRMYSQHCQQSRDQPGMVANLARGQLNRGKDFFPIRVRA